MVWSMSLYAAFVCKAKIGCRLRVKGPFGGGSWYIQRPLCVESHIKVNLAPSALAPPSTNLLSVWWGSWTGSLFQHRGANPPNLSHFSASPSPARNVKVKEVKDAFVQSAPMIAVLAWCAFLCKTGVLFSRILCYAKTTLMVRCIILLLPNGAQVWKEETVKGQLGANSWNMVLIWVWC